MFVFHQNREANLSKSVLRFISKALGFTVRLGTPRLSCYCCTKIRKTIGLNTNRDSNVQKIYYLNSDKYNTVK